MKKIFISIFILVIISVCFVSCQSYLNWYNKTSGTNYQNVWSVNLDSTGNGSSQNAIDTSTYEAYEYESLTNKNTVYPSISSYVDKPKYVITNPLKFEKDVYEIYEYENLTNKNAVYPSISSYVDKPKYVITNPLKFEKDVYEIYEYESLTNKNAVYPSISSYVDKPVYVIAMPLFFK